MGFITNLISNLRLRFIDPKKIKTFSFENLKTYAKVSHVHDGDTINLTFFYGSKPIRLRCRLARIDAPEINSKNEEEVRCAVISRDYLASLINNRIVYVVIGKQDKWNRPLVDIYKNRLDINQHMIDKKYAVPYIGGKKEPFRPSLADLYPHI